MRVSVILPTHNRPELLKEAISSVLGQSWLDWELVVVDDGSVPPAHSVVRSEQPIQWLKNTVAQGLSAARNKGMKASTGEVVTFLDDDDLLFPETLETISTIFQRHQQLECLFINITPFGAAAQGMSQNQNRTLEAVLQRLSSVTWGQEDEVLRPLGDDLFEVLLMSLPLAFQRVAIRRSVLSDTGQYQSGSFGDLEWNYRLALRCRCALLKIPAYRVRCDGQSFFTRNDAHSKVLDASIRIKHQLLTLPEVKRSPRLAAKVVKALAHAEFDRAYFAYENNANFPWKDFVMSARLGPSWRHFSLLVKLLARKLLGNCSGNAKIDGRL